MVNNIVGGRQIPFIENRKCQAGKYEYKRHQAGHVEKILRV